MVVKNPTVFKRWDVILFGVVYVIENMLFAVAVIACALGSVAELQVRVLVICFAAYSTLVMISFL